MEIRLRLCFLSKKFFPFDYFNSIVGVFSRYITKDKGLGVFLKDFGILDRFESIDGSFSGDIAEKGRELFCLFFKSLSSWLVGRCVITSPNDWVGHIVSFERDIKDFCVGLINLVEMFYIPFLCLQGRFYIFITH